MSVADLKKALEQLKTAETLENNEDTTTVGVANVYPNPADRPSGNLDAPWGEPSTPQDGKPHDSQHYGSGVVTEFKQDRADLLARVFSGMPEYSAEAKGVIAQNFSSEALQNHESHSPLLTRKTAAKRMETLAEQVRAKIGHR